jgi:Flp pilus assembly protein TadD
MSTRIAYLAAALIFGGSVLAQQAPPIAPAGPPVPAASPGLTPALAQAAAMIRDGQYANALARIDEVLAKDARNPQARFLKGVVQTDQDELDDAVLTFRGLTEDFPELPEPHNNLAVIWAQQGHYDMARAELEIAIKARPDYAVAHENLGDVYTRLAGAEYDRAVALDKTNKSAQAKLSIVRELYAVAPSTTAPKVAVPKPAKVKPVTPAKPK